MPTAPARPCRLPSCPRTTTARDGYCDTCRPKVRKAFDSQPHRKEHHAFYASKAWRACRAAVLARDPVCVKCHDRLSSVGAHKVPAKMLRLMAEVLPLHIAEATRHLQFQEIARSFGLHATSDGEVALFRTATGLTLFQARWDLLSLGHDYALDPDAVEGWCKPCHDADSGREAHRAAVVGSGRPRR